MHHDISYNLHGFFDINFPFCRVKSSFEFDKCVLMFIEAYGQIGFDSNRFYFMAVISNVHTEDSMNL